MYNYIIDKCWAYFNLHTKFHSYEWKMSRENINHIIIKKMLRLLQFTYNCSLLGTKNVEENINHIVIKEMMRCKVNMFRFVTKT
jgi:hypothetical protein